MEIDLQKLYFGGLCQPLFDFTILIIKLNLYLNLPKP